MFLLERLIAPLAPFDCVVCGREDALLCAWCRPEAIMPVPSRCCLCFSATKAHATCKNCRRKPMPGHVWVATEYEQTAKQLIYRLKFERAQAAADLIADLLDETLPHLPASTVVTHVPTAPSRVRMRGYDHAQLIAKSLAAKRDLRYVRLLARSGTSRQVGARREQRLQQLAQAFRPLPTANATLPPILVIDDVLTTGATLQAVTTTLKQAGVPKIYAATFAQKR